MDAPRPFKRLGLLFRRLLHLLARPVPRRRGLVIHPFRGYGYAFPDDGDTHRIFLMGRVLRQPFAGPAGPVGKVVQDLLGVVRRALRWGAAGVEVHVEAGSSRSRVFTDSDGFFRVEMTVHGLHEGEEPVHDVHLRIPRTDGPTVTGGEAAGARRTDGSGETDPKASPRAEATGQVYVPRPGSPFLVISDIDDTVVHTGVASKLAMLWNTFMEGAESKIAFPGVAAFYRALHLGPSGSDRIPLIYVSRGPWSIYEVLLAFLGVHRFPEKPVLFLRDWGMTLRHPLPKRGMGHKESLVRKIVADFPDLPLVLIGDSGQQDPEIYAEVVRENPGRILAVYIRNVTRTPERDAAIQALAGESARTGTELTLAEDSFAMAEDAADRGLIARAALPEVLRERSGASPKGNTIRTGR